MCDETSTAVFVVVWVVESCGDGKELLLMSSWLELGAFEGPFPFLGVGTLLERSASAVASPMCWILGAVIEHATFSLRLHCSFACNGWTDIEKSEVLLPTRPVHATPDQPCCTRVDGTSREGFT